jgi:hypothetical protein
MPSPENQLEELEHYFFHYSSFFLKDTQNKLDLAQALQDTDAAMKEESKLEAMNAARELFGIARKEQTLEAVTQKYHELLETYCQERQQEIEAARTNGDKEALVRAQIHLNIATAPARGFFHGAYRQATKEFVQVTHEK